MLHMSFSSAPFENANPLGVCRMQEQQQLPWRRKPHTNKFATDIQLLLLVLVDWLLSLPPLSSLTSSSSPTTAAMVLECTLAATRLAARFASGAARAAEEALLLGREPLGARIQWSEAKHSVQERVALQVDLWG